MSTFIDLSMSFDFEAIIHPYGGYFVFQVHNNSTPSHNNHIILPSGIFIIGIDVWVERFTKIFEKDQ
jgi:hypothetical protein